VAAVTESRKPASRAQVTSGASTAQVRQAGRHHVAWGQVEIPFTTGHLLGRDTTIVPPWERPTAVLDASLTRL
jgi:hypothetical protein